MRSIVNHLRDFWRNEPEVAPYIALQLLFALVWAVVGILQS